MKLRDTDWSNRSVGSLRTRAMPTCARAPRVAASAEATSGLYLSAVEIAAESSSGLAASGAAKAQRKRTTGLEMTRASRIPKAIGSEWPSRKYHAGEGYSQRADSNLRGAAGTNNASIRFEASG